MQMSSVADAARVEPAEKLLIQQLSAYTAPSTLGLSQRRECSQTDG
jgi:hypothetical protein